MRTETATWIGNVPGHCEGLPGGAFIFSIPGVGVRTNFVMRALPPGNTAASYCRIADDGYRIACQGQNDDRAWLWNSEWRNLGVPAFGPNACIFNGDGDPWVISHAPAVGYRYVRDDRSVATCEETYADASRGLYEFTDYGDVAIGQGGKPNQGAVARFADDGILRRLTINGRAVLGTIRNIRVRRNGDEFCRLLQLRHTHGHDPLVLACGTPRDAARELQARDRAKRPDQQPSTTETGATEHA